MPIGRYTGDWAIDGVAIPSPHEHIVGHEGLQTKDSGRAEDGYMVKEWVRDDVMYIDVTYKALTAAEKDALWALMRGRDFSFSYYDNGSRVIGSAYCNKFTYEPVNRHMNADEGGRVSNIKFRIVEN